MMRLAILMLTILLLGAMLFWPSKSHIKEKMVYRIAGPDTTIVNLDSTEEKGWFKMGAAVHVEDYLITGGKGKNFVVVDDSCREIHFGNNYTTNNGTETIARKTNGHWKILNSAKFLQAKRFLMEQAARMKIQWKKQYQDSI